MAILQFPQPKLAEKTGEGVCIVDLDTVMPGLSINDFGDSIRFGANHCAEDERDLSKVGLDLRLFELYTRAFLEGAGGTLTDEEIAYLPWGAGCASSPTIWRETCTSTSTGRARIWTAAAPSASWWPTWRPTGMR